tara:strand:- start:329 stop:553 length:225 start_codon:yes stop_codon:yes gene_type:complete
MSEYNTTPGMTSTSVQPGRKHVEIEFAGTVALDGQTKPAGEFHIREYEEDEWVGGSYATYDTLTQKIWEFLSED